MNANEWFQIFYEGDGVNVDYFFQVPTIDSYGYLVLTQKSTAILLILITAIALLILYFGYNYHKMIKEMKQRGNRSE